MSIKRIFNKDCNLPLKSTMKSPLDSQRDINGDLGKWGVTVILWKWDLDKGICQITFKLPKEKFHGIEMSPAVRLTPPIIWRKKGRNKPAEIDWRLSIRLLYWYIHYQLAWVYANQSSPIVAFLPHIQTGNNETLKDIILPRLTNLKGLPYEEEPEIIEVERAKENGD